MVIKQNVGTARSSVTDAFKISHCTNNGKFRLVHWQWTTVRFFWQVNYLSDCDTNLSSITGKDKQDMALMIDFDHLSLQMVNIEPKQEQKLAAKALLSGKYAMAVLPTRPDSLEWLYCLQEEGEFVKGHGSKQGLTPLFSINHGRNQAPWLFVR